MPIKCARGKPRYNVKSFKSGSRVRLAWCGNKVVEAKNLGKSVVGKKRK